MKAKTFDGVKMKRRGALRVHERLKDMTVEQQVEYWRRRSEEFLGKQPRSRDKQDAPSTPSSSPHQ